MSTVPRKRGGWASVIRTLSVDDKSVCLLPRCWPFSPLFEARKVQAHPRLPGIIRQTRPQSHVEISQARFQRCAWGPSSNGETVLGDRTVHCSMAVLRASLTVHRARHKRDALPLDAQPAHGIDPGRSSRRIPTPCPLPAGEGDDIRRAPQKHKSNSPTASSFLTVEVT